MNQKLIHLIAAQFGIILGLVAWMVYSRLPVAEPQAGAEDPNISMAPVAASIPVSNVDLPRPYTRPYQPEPLAQPIAPQPVVEQYYDQQTALQPVANENVANPGYYAQTAQEPAPVESGYGYDYTVPTPFFYGPIQNVQTVVYFNSGHRFRQHCLNPVGPNPNRCPVRPRQQINPSPLPPVSPRSRKINPPANKPPGTIRVSPPNNQPPPAPMVVAGPKRSGSPVSSKTGRINSFAP